MARKQILKTSSEMSLKDLKTIIRYGKTGSNSVKKALKELIKRQGRK